MPNTESWIEKKCVEKGLRLTEQRRVIAKVLANSDDHPDAEELYARASAIDPKISLATVYRTVRLFADSGIIEMHDFRDLRHTTDQWRREDRQVPVGSLRRCRWTGHSMSLCHGPKPVDPDCKHQAL